MCVVEGGEGVIEWTVTRCGAEQVGRVGWTTMTKKDDRNTDQNFDKK